MSASNGDQTGGGTLYISAPNQSITIEGVKDFLEEKLSIGLSDEAIRDCLDEFSRNVEGKSLNELQDQPLYFSAWSQGVKKVYSVYITPEKAFQLNVTTR